MMNIDKLWKELETELLSGLAEHRRNGILTRLATPESGQRLRVGIEWPSKCRVLLFDTAKNSLPPPHTWPDCHGLELSLEKNSDGADSLLLRLRDTRLEDVFAILAEDLARKIVDSHPQQAGHRVLACISRWQKFLSNARRTLSREVSRGLWGELWALEKVLIPAVGIEKAIIAWRGPFGAPQDFQFTSMGLEIKTRAAKPPAIVSISSEFQLYAAPWAHLFVGHLAIDEQEGSGETLPQRIHAIRMLIKDSSMCELLEDVLLEIGWVESLAQLHSERGFFLREAEYFKVAEGFPCIVPSLLPSGVGRVTYDLSIDALKPFAVSSSCLVATLKADTAPLYEA